MPICVSLIIISAAAPVSDTTQTFLRTPHSNMHRALKHRISVTPLAQFKLWGKNRQDDNGQCWQGLEATQLLITLMEVLHPVTLLLAPFMWNIMSLSAWPLRQNEGKRGATCCQMVQRNEDSIRLTDPSPAFWKGVICFNLIVFGGQ